MHTKVGIFWLVDDVIIGDAVSQEEAEPYGDALQHGGHYEFWEGLVPGTVQERRFKSHAYDYYPRGRMVLFPLQRMVRLYVDGCLGNRAIKDALAYFGSVGYSVEIEQDWHYRCAACNPCFLE